MSEDQDSHFSFIGDGEMDIPIAHLPKYTESPGDIVDVWLEMFEKGILTPAQFKDHWRIWVPKYYALQPSTSWDLEMEKEHDVLIGNLERFIANGNFDDTLKKLSNLDNPPSVCGKVFKVGEPTYSCRECGMDSTCVLCVSCFKQSPHRHHSYKMGTSLGGGCCDCGDTEAWKSDPFCDVHLAGTKVKSEGRKGFPPDMAERCKVAFTGILKYAYQILTLEHSPGLPHDLRLKDTELDPFSFLDSPDMYCTVLYNDEVHTFEQVINTLSKIVKCPQRDAIEFVTNIDREGRAVVKCTMFQQCQELKTEIERYTSKHGTQPLKVEVVHTHVIAHQVFAMRLLRWMQKILANSESFRLLFTEVALARQPPDASIVDGILLRDSQLWKSARSHWHRLFISGMLMEYSSKKALAIAFTRNYGTVLKDFIRDDHDHSFSIASLSVQIFTVPTLIHHLIAYEEVLFILLNTFYSECSRKLNKNGKLEFERNVANQTFKRAQCILYDLRYLLSAVPNETQWTTDLRKAFLRGLKLFLDLLGCMQGMDAVTRQVVQHMEFEPEWESAFNLHIKLAHVITLFIQWAGSDRTILIKSFRLLLTKLSDSKIEMAGAMEVRELADHSVSCIQYDVATQPVSIHLPLSRFFAGLYLSLEKHGLCLSSPELQTPNRPSLEQIIEPVLRTQVMISQVNSGMWRRNGYSLLNQLYFYHNVRCRSEMLDRDIMMLQIAASQIQSDEFLLHLLNKFYLLNWADPQFEEQTLKKPEEETLRQPISMVEEFLGLLINIVGERHVPCLGKVTDDDRIKKEILQQLCIKPLPHSELNKTLPDDVNHETGMERVIDDVATFKKPTQATGKGVYELKPELFERYNMFYYHYTKEELSKSEEAQRKRRKAAGELECCPPPKLVPLTETFSTIPDLLQCDVMLYILQTVLQRCINLRARSFSEHQLQKVLHLVGYALLEEESNNYPYLKFTERSAKWDIEKLIEELHTSPRVEAHKDLLSWTLNKFRQVKAEKENIEVSAAPSTDPPGSEGNSKDFKEWRAKMAAEKREKIMAQMRAMQKTFMKENAKLFEATTTCSESEKQCELLMELCEVEDKEPVTVGPQQTARALQEAKYTCILCQEDTVVTPDGPSLVLSAFVQKSTVHAHSRSGVDKTDEVLRKPLFLPTSQRPQPHTSTCGHVMHTKCWQTYFDNVLAKENRRPYRLRQPTSFDVEKQEFLCPLCETISNTVLPLLPPLGALVQTSREPRPQVTFEEFVDGLQTVLRVRNQHQTTTTATTPSSSSSVSSTSSKEDDAVKAEKEEAVCPGAEDGDGVFVCPVLKVQHDMGEAAGDKFMTSLYPVQTMPVLSQSLRDMILLFAQATYTKGLNVNPSFNAFVPVMSWNTCYYTTLSIESLLADQDKPLFGHLSSRQADCLGALTRYAGALAMLWKKANEVSSHTLNLLSTFLEQQPERLTCLLDWDSFGLLSLLTLSLPSLFNVFSPGGIPTGGLMELHLLRLVLLSHITAVLLTTEFKPGETDMETEDQPTLTQEESDLVLDVLCSVKKDVDVSQLSGDHVWSIVKWASVPFLRCSALFFHFLTDVPQPAYLKEQGGDTFENLCKYLGLASSPVQLLQTPKYKQLIDIWLSHERVPAYLESGTFCKIPRTVSSLVSLPQDYSDLINMVSTFTCPNSDREDSRNPTMCLVCGEMLCSQSYCCQQELNKTSVGACTYHANRCGANAGIFLRVRECEVLLLASPNRGCFMTAPYLDRYGETDQGLRRGNPLTLCPDRYRKLNHLWLSHGLHEEIARAIESNNVMSPQWQHL